MREGADYSHNTWLTLRATLLCKYNYSHFTDVDVGSEAAQATQGSLVKEQGGFAVEKV